MGARQVKYIPFTSNMISAVFSADRGETESAVYVFPTEAAKRAAVREYQNRWAFEAIQFLTMEELKQQLFAGERPLLREEKRTLAFFASLTAKDRQFFKISNYFQSIEPAHDFFDLWEEFNEELVAADSVVERLEAAGYELLNWQHEMWKRLRRIKDNYQRFIEDKGFDDILFAGRPEKMSLTLLHEFSTVYFVNQFYYTNLEKKIIEQLEQAGKKVILYYQLPQELVNEDNLSIRPFTFADLGPGVTQSLHIVECRSEFAMLRAMIKAIDAGKARQVINFSERANPRSRLLAQARFNVGGSAPLSSSSIYKFLASLHTIIENIVYEPTRKKLLVPLPAMLNAFLDVNFATALMPELDLDDKEIAHSFYELMDRDYRFADLDGDFIAVMRRNKAAPALQTMLAFLNKVLTITSIDDLVDLIDAPGGIVVNHILSEKEIRFSNVRETFYRALSDFDSLGRLNFVEHWADIFENRRAPQTCTAAGLLRLFLDYLKPRYYRLNTRAPETPRVEFTSLQDTRNLALQKVIVFNVVEREIPHARQTPFLFTDRQRKALGLKIYEDVRLREKYYLHRLVLTTPQVTLLTQKNIEENIDVSSFIEEIRLRLSSGMLQESVVDYEDYRGAYEQVLQRRQDYRVDPRRALVLDFYLMPLDKTRDFPDHSLDLTFYALANLLNNSFVFYIKNMIRLQEKTKCVDADFTAKLIGNIVHEGLNNVWRDYLPEQGTPPHRLIFKEIPESLIVAALRKTLATDRFYFSLPHNYADIYFREIMLPRIVDGIKRFFVYLDRIGLESKAVHIYPEKDEPMLRQAYIPFIKSEKIDFTVNIGGRADLRIEADDASQYCIFDYKTGGSKKEQLMLYELYYYLIENLAPPERVFSYFYQILDAEGKELREFSSRSSKAEQIEQFTENVKNAVRDLWRNGFALPEQKTALEDMKDISRADLFQSAYKPYVNSRGLL